MPGVGFKEEIVDARNYPRFNSQNPAFGEAAKHNADFLQGRKLLVQREAGTQIIANRTKNIRASGVKTKPGMERDEVPPASTSAARDGASVRLMPRNDNQAHGRALLDFYGRGPAANAKVKPGEWFIYE